MNFLVVLALIVAIVLCLLPGIMAYSHYFGSASTEVKSRKVGMKKHVAVSHI